LYGTGVIIDMRHKGKWDIITAEDFEKATPKIEEGDFVVVNTGWQKRLAPDNTIAYEYYNYYPGLVPSAAEWLIKKKVKAIAGTWPVCDHSLSFAPLEKNMPWLYNDYKRETGKEPGAGLGGFEECLTMLLKSGIVCIQNAGGDIDEVTGKRCKLCAWPFRMEETDGAMVRLVAMVE
jgi:kynurenine formamidase